METCSSSQIKLNRKYIKENKGLLTCDVLCAWLLDAQGPSVLMGVPSDVLGREILSNDSTNACCSELSVS